MIELKFNSDQVLEFNFNGEKIFSRSHIKVRDEAGNYSDYGIHFDHDSLTLKCDLGVYGYYQESFRVKGSAVHGRITVKVSTDKKFIVQCPAEYIKNTHPPYYMIPGFLYGTNNIATSDGLQPKFDYGGEPGYPNSSIFYIRSDRSANSSVIRISDGICSMLGIEHVVKDVKIKQIDKWSPAHLFTGLMLDSSMPDKDIAGFQIGYENYPYRYSWEREPGVPKYNEKLCGFIEDLSGEELEVESIYFIENAENNSEYGNALKEFYWKFHQLPLKVGKRREAVNDIGQALISKGYNDKDKIFVLSDDAESMLLGDIAWTGGMQAAFPLLKAGLYADNNLFIGKAIEFIDNVCLNSFNNNSGLMNEEFRKGKWNVTGWWGTREDCFNFGEDPLHSAYLNGQFSYYLLKSFLLVDGNELWLETSKKLLDKVISSQRSDGRIGVFFDPGNGDAVDYDGFQGCWFVPALALMYKITSDTIYIESAESACDHYYSWHLKGELYNTPMDTHRAVDEEGNLAFIVAARELHEITKKTKYL
jgi:hypothetical protein